MDSPKRQLGLFDATMIVMGGIVGSGIFMNPHVVAVHVQTPFLILGVWMAGGAGVQSDGLFFRKVGQLSKRTGAPVVAIVLQGLAATAIAWTGKYEQILNYEVSVDFISFSLAAASLFLFRRQDRRPDRDSAQGSIYLAPGHPYTTALFVLTCVGIVASTIATYPANSGIGIGIMLTGIPVYLYWSRARKLNTKPRPIT